VSAESPGSGGVLRPNPEDFEVREILSYAPSGSGEHLFVRLRKRGITSIDALKRVGAWLYPEDLQAQRFGGIAGLKDRAAVAEQWVSFPFRIDREVPTDLFDDGEVAVLEVARHDRKLRRGHQRGNRFDIRIVNVPPGGAERAQACLARLRQVGVPNRFGTQRFGKYGDNALQAREIVLGKRKPPRDRRLRDLLFSAAQSEAFNAWVQLRFDAGAFDKPLLGDLMQKHATGGLFWADPLDDAAERMARLEISPTGPLPGQKMRTSTGDAWNIELQAIASLGLTPEQSGRLGPGARRVLRYPLDPDAVIIPEAEQTYRLVCTLPSGGYATVLLDELVKPTEPFDRTETSDATELPTLVQPVDPSVK
jgi:tRNA pseudouridine13 synthase